MNDTKTVEAVQWLQDQFCDAKTVNPGAVNNDTTAPTRCSRTARAAST